MKSFHQHTQGKITAGLLIISQLSFDIKNGILIAIFFFLNPLKFNNPFLLLPPPYQEAHLVASLNILETIQSSSVQSSFSILMQE